MANSRLHCQYMTFTLLLVLTSLLGHFLVEAVCLRPAAIAIASCSPDSSEGYLSSYAAREAVASVIHAGFTLPPLVPIACLLIFAFIFTTVSPSLPLLTLSPLLPPPNSLTTIA